VQLLAWSTRTQPTERVTALDQQPSIHTRSVAHSSSNRRSVHRRHSPMKKRAKSRISTAWN